MMAGLRRIWARLRGQVSQAREDAALDEEIREHIARLEERYRAGGKERQRAQRGFLSPAEWWRDVQFGMRIMAKRPALNAAMLLALGLGIEANTAVFSILRIRVSRSR